MSQRPTDPRLQRTDKLLEDTLIELTAERGFDRVTVRDITERAGVNRATFYRHFQDKYALVESIFEEAIRELAQDLEPPREVPSQTDPQNPPERWVRFFEHFSNHQHLYRALLGRNGSSWFVARMRDHVVDLLEEREQHRDRIPSFQRTTPDSEIPRKVVMTLLSTLLISAIAWWLESGKEYSPQQIASWFLEMTVNGYAHALGV